MARCFNNAHFCINFQRNYYNRNSQGKVGHISKASAANNAMSSENCMQFQSSYLAIQCTVLSNKCYKLDVLSSAHYFIEDYKRAAEYWCRKTTCKLAYNSQLCIVWWMLHYCKWQQWYTKWTIIIHGFQWLIILLSFLRWICFTLDKHRLFFVMVQFGFVFHINYLVIYTVDFFQMDNMHYLKYSNMSMHFTHRQVIAWHWDGFIV